MPNEKFNKVGADGMITEQEALSSSAGVADAGKIVCTGADGKINPNMIPDIEVKSFEFTEECTDCLVNIYDVAGTLKARKADASVAGKQAHGFIRGTVANAATGNVYFEGIRTGLADLTPGAKYWLSNVAAGGVVDAPVTTANHYLQFIGIALSATEMTFEPEQPIKRA